MNHWKITLGNGQTFTCQWGNLESTLRQMRGQYGTDDFTVEAVSHSPYEYVPELGDREVPDTIPEEWT